MPQYLPLPDGNSFEIPEGVTLSAPSTAGVSNGATIYFGDTSGDLWLNSTTLTTGQTLEITVYTRTAPGA